MRHFAVNSKAITYTCVEINKVNRFYVLESTCCLNNLDE